MLLCPIFLQACLYRKFEALERASMLAQLVKQLDVLEELHRRGWLYLYDGRGVGPLPASALPAALTGLQDDPYRSLVWKLKREKRIAAQPLIPFHEFRWGAWLRRRPLPPFSSDRLDPALPGARALVASPAASHLAGWTGAPLF